MGKQPFLTLKMRIPDDFEICGIIPQLLSAAGGFNFLALGVEERGA